MTKDFVYVEQGRKETFATMVQGTKMGFAQMTTISDASVVVKTCKVTGANAVVLSTHTVKGTMLDEHKKSHTFEYGGDAEERFVKQGGKWMLQRMEWKSMTAKMDGKVQSGA